MSATLLQPAFADPVLDAQRSFRAALKALANPGQAQALGTAHVPPALPGLGAASHALCLALLDLDTPLWLAPAFDTPAIRANLSLHCGCPITQARGEARFALLDASCLEDLSGFATGDDRAPDLSCTLLVQLQALAGGAANTWAGPGIRDHRRAELPVPALFWAERATRNHFPRGLDVLFLAARHLVGLPRSTRVTQGVLATQEEG